VFWGPAPGACAKTAAAMNNINPRARIAFDTFMRAALFNNP